MTTLRSAAGQWQLNRYPIRSHDPLQAWDAADELLHDIIAQRDDQQPLLVNDQFGALLLPLAGLAVASQADSYISHCAWHANLASNQLPNTLQPLSPLDNAPAATDVVYLKIPKSQSLLEFQLAKLAAELAPGTQLFAAAKSKLFTPTVRALFEQYCTGVDVSLIQRKCRTLSAKLTSAPIQAEQFVSTWQVPEFNLSLQHHAGVFARNQLDIGARFMLSNMPPSGAERVIDLGCGNGVLGLRYAQLSPASQITWVDESFLAIASTRANIEQNLTGTPSSTPCSTPCSTTAQYHAQVDDCLAQQDDHSCDLILCNPPFHQEHAVTEHIARQMFRDSQRVLRKNGELWVVANRHLPYYQPLKRLFKQVHQVAQNSKFVILKARG
ncbi:MAG: class I SAM-dependent methyltransferase [Gammaproteobacteria bacterium]|nr:class I SAM-dependent methyltransferase [Gammaproteobacteria bacterium]